MQTKEIKIKKLRKRPNLVYAIQMKQDNIDDVAFFLQNQDFDVVAIVNIDDIPIGHFLVQGVYSKDKTKYYTLDAERFESIYTKAANALNGVGLFKKDIDKSLDRAIFEYYKGFGEGHYKITSLFL